MVLFTQPLVKYWFKIHSTKAPVELCLSEHSMAIHSRLSQSQYLYEFRVTFYAITLNIDTISNLYPIQPHWMVKWISHQKQLSLTRLELRSVLFCGETMGKKMICMHFHIQMQFIFRCATSAFMPIRAQLLVSIVVVVVVDNVICAMFTRHQPSINYSTPRKIIPLPSSLSTQFAFSVQCVYVSWLEAKCNVTNFFLATFYTYLMRCTS